MSQQRVPDAEDRVQLAGGDRPTRHRSPRTAAPAVPRRPTSSSACSTSPPTSSTSTRSRSGARTSSRPTRSRTRRITGATYDTGEYDKALDGACSSTPATTSCAPSRRHAASATTRSCSASALSSYVEITAPVGLYREWGKVEIEDDGTVLAYVGTSSHGQGHETAFSMIVSDVLGVPMEQITILQSDTTLIPQGGGTGGSRSLQIGGQRAARSRARRCSTQAKQLAAHLLEANADDIVARRRRPRRSPACPRARCRGPTSRARCKDDDAPARGHGGAARARARLRRRRVVVPVRRARRGRRDRPRDRPGRAAAPRRGRRLRPHRQPAARHGPAARRHRAGRRAGAVRGTCSTTTTRNPITANLMDYAMPSAAELPSFEVYNTETPSPLNPLGAKGIGESATIGSTPAVHNADRRRAVASRRPPHRHAVHGRARVARDPGRRAGDMSRTVRDTDAAADGVAVPHDRRRTATTGCPTRRAACSPDPSATASEPTGVDHRGAPVRERGRVGAHVHRRLARPAARRARRRGARRGARRLLAQPHAHRRVPVADRRAAGRVVSELDLRAREPARPSRCCAAYRIRDGEIAEIPVVLDRG